LVSAKLACPTVVNPPVSYGSWKQSWWQFVAVDKVAVSEFSVSDANERFHKGSTLTWK
jgi:hypothetical protein